MVRVFPSRHRADFFSPDLLQAVISLSFMNVKGGKSMPDEITGKQQMPARVITHGAVISGRLSLLAFTVFLFCGPFNLVDTNRQPYGWLVWDALLSSLFFIQHSGMIRRNFRAWMAKRIPDCYIGAVFTLSSSLALALVVVFWQSSGPPLFDLHGPLRWLARGVFFSAVAGTGWGFWSLKGFDPYGIGPLKARLSGTPVQNPSLTFRGPYLWVRHPLYFFVLLMLWFCPDPTADRLFFNMLWTGWIFAGAVFEEKDLLDAFGDDYREYQKEVPMLIPWKGFTRKKKEDDDVTGGR
jgi:methanethiol S-methyltransferase